MRARVFAGREEGGAAREPAAHAGSEPAATAVVGTATCLVELGWHELVRLGLSTQRGFPIVLGVLVAANELDLLDRSLLQELSSRLSWQAALDDLLLSAGLLLVATILIAGCLSVGWAVLRFHGYSLSRCGEELRWRAGLFTLRSTTIPRSRIQLVAVHESLLQRWSGGVSVRVETAGGSGEEGMSAETRRWFVPWVARERLYALLAELDPEWGARPPAWRSPAPGFRKRMARRAAALGLSVGMLGVVWVEPWGALAFALWPALLTLELREARFLAWARSAGGIAFRSGAWRRVESYVRSARLQSVRVRSSPFDRRWGMATLSVDTAGAGPAAHAIRVPYLAREDAVAAARELTREAGAHGFEW
jgi:putative membrane protein